MNGAHKKIKIQEKHENIPSLPAVTLPSLPYDVMVDCILSRFSLTMLYNFCLVSKQTYKIFKIDRLWQALVNRDFNFTMKGNFSLHQFHGFIARMGTDIGGSIMYRRSYILHLKLSRYLRLHTMNKCIGPFPLFGKVDTVTCLKGFIDFIGHTSVLRFMYQHGIDFSFFVVAGTPYDSLMIRIFQDGCVPAAKQLTAYKYPISQVMYMHYNIGVMSALSVAIDNNRITMVKYLLCDLKLKFECINERTFLNMNLDVFEAIARIIIPENLDPYMLSGLIIAAHNNQRISLSELLMKAWKESKYTHTEEKNLLDRVYKYNDPRLLKLVLLNGVKLGINDILLLAASRSQALTVEMLLKAGGDPNYRGKFETVLSAAISLKLGDTATTKQLRTIKVLLDYGGVYTKGAAFFVPGIILNFLDEYKPKVKK